MSYIRLDPDKLAQEMALRGLSQQDVGAGAQVKPHTVGRALRGDRVQWDKAMAIVRYVRSIPVDEDIRELVVLPPPISAAS